MTWFGRSDQSKCSSEGIAGLTALKPALADVFTGRAAICTHSWKTEIEPATASEIGIRKSCPTRVNSTIKTSAVSGIFIDDARKAGLPTIAKPAKDPAGHICCQKLPRMMPSSPDTQTRS